MGGSTSTVYSCHTESFRTKYKTIFDSFVRLFTQESRVGNSIIGFSIASIVICDRKIESSIRSLKRPNRSRWSFSKIDEIDSITVALFQRWTRAIRSVAQKGGNCQKHTKNTFFKSNRSFLVIERSIPSSKKSNCYRRSFLKIDGIDSITSIFFKYRQERFDHGRSF